MLSNISGPRRVGYTFPVSSFSTTFPTVENPLSEGGNWLNGAADGLDWLNFQVSTGRAHAASASSDSPPPYNDAIAILKSSAFTPAANCWVEKTIYVENGYIGINGETHEGGLFFRFSLSAHDAHGYECYWSITNAFNIVRWNGPLNDFTVLALDSGTGPASIPAHGDVLRIEMSGSSITAKVNGSVVATATDATYASGQPGMQHYATSGIASAGKLGSYGAQSFRAGNL